MLDHEKLFSACWLQIKLLLLITCCGCCWSQQNLNVFSSQSKLTVPTANNQTAGLCEITNKLRFFPLQLCCDWMKTLGWPRLKSLHCNSCLVLSVLYWVFKTVENHADLPAFFINAVISLCVIFSPKDLIIRANSLSVTIPSLSPSNREKHSLNSTQKQQKN